MRGTSSFWLNILAGMALAAAAIIPARAQDPDDLKRGVARISLINGEVSVQRGDSGEFVAASVNAPLLTNDRISTAPNSRAEVQFDSGNILRSAAMPRSVFRRSNPADIRWQWGGEL